MIGVNKNKFLVLIRIDSVVLCGYGTWSVVLREEYVLREFGNRLLRETR